MARLILQIKNNDKMYNKFILISKLKNNKEEIVYGLGELMASKDISIDYYNILLKEGDFNSILKVSSLEEIMKKLNEVVILKYINTNFKELEDFLKNLLTKQ